MNSRLAAALVAAALPGAAFADGATVFAETCAACHAEGGVGTPGLAPPLDLVDFWAGLGEKAPAYVAGVLSAGLTGKISAGGVDYIGLAMPAQAHLSVEEAAEVATYVLASLGGQTGLAVTPAMIEADRAAPPSHADLRAMRKGG
jgi:mono/diheme cytochrome c family protein